MNLKKLGWNTELEQHFEPYNKQGYSLGRVIIEHRNSYRVITTNGEMSAEISGKLRFESISRQDFPAVGDWVAVKENSGHDHASIHAILPRKSKFSRKIAGNTTEEQIVATNIDTVFLVNSLNHDFNLNRIDRYLVIAWESGANPVVVLSKADLCEAEVVARRINRVESIAAGVPIHVISSISKEGLESLSPYLGEGQSIALVGSSGVGKSTLINTLLGEEVQKVAEVRHTDSRGRHTTTHRELLLLPSGAVVIDTPGMRELHLWGADSGVARAFEDIEQLAKQCFFNDCEHRKEPRCAVQLAIREGRLAPNRLANYRNLGGELAKLSEKAMRDYREVKEGKGKKLAKRIIEKERGRNSAKFRKGLQKDWN